MQLWCEQDIYQAIKTVGMLGMTVIESILLGGGMKWMNLGDFCLWNYHCAINAIFQNIQMQASNLLIVREMRLRLFVFA